MYTRKLTDGSVTDNRDFTVYAFFLTFIDAFLLLIFQSMVLDLNL